MPLQRTTSGQIERICEACGVPFYVFPAAIRKGPACFCSRACMYDARTRPREERFWAMVDTSGECWEWTGYRLPAGYGQFDKQGAHRVAYELTYGPIPENTDVCHRCDNPPCVRPIHLFPGTRTENMQDASQKGRATAPKGHHNQNSKIVESDVRQIRIDAANGIPHTALACRHGVASQTIDALIAGRTWKHVS